ncbi:MAG: glycosyltransferase [Gammaproteobacteria bacterium]
MRWGALKRALRALPGDDFDLVHIHTPFVAHYAGAWYAKRIGVPCIATYHTFFEEYLHHLRAGGSRGASGASWPSISPAPSAATCARSSLLRSP